MRASRRATIFLDWQSLKACEILVVLTLIIFEVDIEAFTLHNTECASLNMLSTLFRQARNSARVTRRGRFFTASRFASSVTKEEVCAAVVSLAEANGA